MSLFADEYYTSHNSYLYSMRDEYSRMSGLNFTFYKRTLGPRVNVHSQSQCIPAFVPLP
jgi:hypothetical protein